MAMDFEPYFTITNRITNALSRIERARGFLEGANLSFEWIQEMRDRALSLEAHHTTHIEGTQLTFAQSKKLLTGSVVPGTDPDDVRELLNYRDTSEFVSAYLDSGVPINDELIFDIHKRLVRGVRNNEAAPGEYRKIQNYIVDSITHHAIYTPPPPDRVPHLMDDLIDWLGSEHDIHPIVISGIAQFQLVNIHPFLDGNGRTARLLSTLLLYRSGYDFKEIFTISEYYDRDRPAYYDAIQNVRENDMDLTGWLEYFCDGLLIQVQEVQELGEHFVKLDTLTRKHDLSNRQQLALKFVMRKGKLTIRDFEKLCPDSTRRTLQRDLKMMAEMGLLVSEGSTNRLIYILKE